MSTIEKMLAAITGLAALVFIVILTLLSAKIGKLNKELDAYKNAPADTTITVQDDTIKPLLKMVAEFQKERDSIQLLVNQLRTRMIILEREGGIRDTIREVDTIPVLVQLPRTTRDYADTNYFARVSGYEPKLDSLWFKQRTVYRDIVKTVIEPAKVPFLKGFAGLTGAKEIGGSDFLAGANLGAIVKGKHIISIQYQRSIKAEKNYIGFSAATTF